MKEMDGTLPMSMTDLELAACAEANPAIFASIYDHYFSRVYMYIRYRVGDPSIADDLTSKVFERVIQKFGGYSPKRAPFVAWLFTIARNVVNDHFRATRRHPSLPWEAMNEQASDGSLPEEIVIQQEEQRRLLRAVAILKERERELIALKFTSGLKNRQIAEMLRLTEKNISVILFRAVRNLRANLKGLE
jgi:RNA polymerase sigma-70 factor, ECF subfamily